MHFFQKLDNAIAKTETWVLILVLTGMMGLSFGQVIYRNLFEGGWLWADILLRQLVLWVGFIGASLAVRERKHLSIDLLSYLLRGPRAKWLHMVTGTAAGCISLLLAWAAWDFVLLEKEAESFLFAQFPVWWFQVILPYSFAMIGFRFFLMVGSDLIQKSETVS